MSDCTAVSRFVLLFPSFSVPSVRKIFFRSALCCLLLLFFMVATAYPFRLRALSLAFFKSRSHNCNAQHSPVMTRHTHRKMSCRDTADVRRTGSCPVLAASLGRGGSKRAHCSTPSSSAYRRVYIAVGSNMGDRFQNIASALRLLVDQDGKGKASPVRMVKTSFLHETAPMYVTDQSYFLNGVVELGTTLEPHDLLARIKRVEEQLGRDFSGIRNGPRPVDLDILFMDESSPSMSGKEQQVVLDTPDLIVPHPRLAEREFVLSPLCELTRDLRHPTLNVTVGHLYDEVRKVTSDKEQTAVRSLPLPRGRMLCFNETIVMGVLNVTPDSFSDGGVLKGSADLAKERALQMELEGAGIIDIGGESTRPGAKEVSIQEELERTIPVIQRIRQESDIPISIDTRHALVAKAAVEAGADIVNDVSGGSFDPEMLSTVAEMQVPIILMHMRGTPETMQNMTDYDDIVSEVADALLERSREAELAGIPRWLQILDPGIGFAKNIRGNLLLLKHLDQLQSLLGEFPILLGTSRKGFIGRITGESEPEKRDFGSVASCIAALCGGKNHVRYSILRVHNVKGMKQAAMVMDAIKKAQ